ncbi:MAG TPA: cytochrome c [Chromatiales bacterium]|nr:cytochrome c [Chromatiales bacterium]
MRKGVMSVGIAALVMGFSSAVVAGGDPAAGKEKAGICESCHGPGGRSLDPENNPVLAGKSEAYLLKALKEFKEGKRSPGPMAALCQTLSDQDMADLAAYFASQKP